MDNTIDLSPCPFCGGDVRIIGDFFVFVTCCKCGIMVGGVSLTNVADKWNRRVDNQEMISLLERVRNLENRLAAYALDTVSDRTQRMGSLNRLDRRGW